MEWSTELTFKNDVRDEVVIKTYSNFDFPSIMWRERSERGCSEPELMYRMTLRLLMSYFKSHAFSTFIQIV